MEGGGGGGFCVWKGGRRQGEGEVPFHEAGDV